MNRFAQLEKRIAEVLPHMKGIANEPMSRHTSFRIGGPARYAAFPEDRETVETLLALAQEYGVEPFVMGNGSNLLVADEGLERLVILTTAMKKVLPHEDSTLTAQAGALLSQTAVTACEAGLSGLEFAHGIPGTVGGGIYMNAVAYGGEMQQVVRRVTMLLPGQGVKDFSAAEMEFAYRHSKVKELPGAVVLEAEFALEKGDSEEIRQTMRDYAARRKASQPLEYPSAGSTFKRPAGYYAAALIDQCGLKGCRVGGAQVSEKHAGFVINAGGATCADVLELMEVVKQTVYEQTGVTLEPEVRIIP